MLRRSSLSLLFCFGIWACDASYFELPQGDGALAGHAHEPLFGGVLHEVGEHFAHLELLVDEKHGELTLYVLDAHAEAVVKIPEEAMVVRLTSFEPSLEVTLEPEASLLGDERPGHASAFYGRHDGLRGVQRFEGYVASPITIRGYAFERIPLRYPEGTEPTAKE